MEHLIAKALQFGRTTHTIEVGENTITSVGQLLKRTFPNQQFFIVADENTYPVAEKQLKASFRKAQIEFPDSLIFPSSPPLKADYAHTLTIASHLQQRKNPIAIALGSGTINDLVKLAAHKIGKPYVCIATACSVDGYASDGAALLTEGVKRTHWCPAPAIVIGDPLILETAPPLLQASGYADLMAKIPSGADWIVADFLNEDPIDKVGWSLAQEHLRNFLADPTDSGAIFTGLTLCGIAMQYMQDSRPVSGCEHLLSHIWEMEEHECNELPLYHGIKVGIGSLLSTKVYETLFERGVEGGEELHLPPSLVENKLEKLKRVFPSFSDISFLETAVKEKYKDREAIAIRRNSLYSNWATLQIRLKEQLIPYSTMKEILATAGCPTTLQEVCLSATEVASTFEKAQLIRHRYTLLDILDDVGLMNNIKLYVDFC